MRAAGQALNAALNLLTMFLAELFYLSLLCALHWGIWLLFAGCCGAGAATLVAVLPETKGVNYCAAGGVPG